MNANKESCTCDQCKASCISEPEWFWPGEAENAASHCGLSLSVFFREYLMVDRHTYRGKLVLGLAPLILGHQPGTLCSVGAHGRCVFLTDADLCSVHPVKPFECREYLHTDTKKQTRERTEEVVAAWATPVNQRQIKELLEMAYEDFLVQRATLQKGTVTGRSEDGQVLVTYATVADNVPCRMMPQLRTSLDIALRVGIQEEWTHAIVTMPIREVMDELGALWQFLLGGSTYVVVFVHNPARRDHHLRFFTRRL